MQHQDRPPIEQSISERYPQLSQELNDGVPDVLGAIAVHAIQSEVTKVLNMSPSYEVATIVGGAVQRGLIRKSARMQRSLSIGDKIRLTRYD